MHYNYKHEAICMHISIKHVFCADGK
jgi:hypothetical protein